MQWFETSSVACPSSFTGETQRHDPALRASQFGLNLPFLLSYPWLFFPNCVVSPRLSPRCPLISVFFCPGAFAHPLPFRCNAPTSEQLPSNKKNPTVRPTEISVLGSHLCSTSNACGASHQCHPHCILHRLRIIWGNVCVCAHGCG